MDLSKENVLKLVSDRSRAVMVQRIVAAKSLLVELGSIPELARLLEEIIADEERRRTSPGDTSGGPVSDGSGGWYVPNEDEGTIWSRVKEHLRKSIGEAVESVDEMSNKVVQNLANPAVQNAKAKGLVVGRVQSGKTGNFTAVAAKAVDSGYRFIIVLAGMYDNLREQTQERLDNDLFAHIDENKVVALTDVLGDIAPYRSTKPTMQALANSFHSNSHGGKVVTAVVKKNLRRLEHLLELLQGLDSSGSLEHMPVLIIDDESDQASPNTKADKETRSAINDLIVRIAGTVRRGTYLAYTATPFANIFSDPNDEATLYPSDFIIPLPKPVGYSGGEEFFGVSGEFIDHDGQETADFGLIRSVASAEAQVLVPKSPKARRESGSVYSPTMQPGLEESIRWFLLASAIRHYRGQHNQHSSMLIHTATWTDAHFTIRDLVLAFIGSIQEEAESNDYRKFEALYTRELAKISVSSTGPMLCPQFTELLPYLNKIIGLFDEASVVADNGESDFRIKYEENDPQVVIVVGGNTLSRGLTLEGLVVSFFLRASRMYDTLLQMGRWFGFRTGYLDLVRLWTTDELAKDFAFLAGVENELRARIVELAESGHTPASVGPEVRAHAGNLQITSKSKMFFTKNIKIALGGTRRQTTMFPKHNKDFLIQNQQAARKLVREAAPSSTSSFTDPGSSSQLFEDVSADAVISFLKEYRVYEKHELLQPSITVPWIEEHVTGNWNVVLRGSSRGRADFAFTAEALIPMGSRTIDKNDQEGYFDVRTLMSGADPLIDYIVKANALGESAEELNVNTAEAQMMIRKREGNRPLLILYPITRMSSEKTVLGEVVRRGMNAEADVIGMGLVLPSVGVSDAKYVGVVPVLGGTYDDDESDEYDYPERTSEDKESDYVPAPIN
ncbi:Z1 domain-containing protein [Glutamicibacter ardleyensis]|uniref:Z1 domain-containing protein n=1 Tax=Glutamicibacter ardleyensis TaxID=225894 RepID=UPI003FD0E497